MEVYKVGDKIAMFKGHPDGLKLGISEGGLTLRLLYDRPTTKEIKEIRSGSIDYRLAVAEDVIFLLLKFGTQSFSDCPYNINFNPDCILEYPEDDKGYACVIELIDTSTGELKVIRLISFSTDFSRKFKELIDEQREKYVSDLNIAMAMAKYTTTQLVEKAIAQGKIPPK